MLKNDASRAYSLLRDAAASAGEAGAALASAPRPSPMTVRQIRELKRLRDQVARASEDLSEALERLETLGHEIDLG